MKKCFLASLFLFIVHFSFGQKSFLDACVYQTWNSFGGLTGATVNDIVQTKDGYLNIGTYEGLVRFDGIEFTTIRRARGNNYKFSSVRAILEDSDGNLWLGSNDEGLHKIMPDGTDEVYNAKNGLPNNSVRALCEDKSGNIWIGTAAGVVYLDSDGILISPKFQEGTVPKGIISTSLYCDTLGRVWLITSKENGLFLFSDGIFHTVPQFDKYFANYSDGKYFATSITQDLGGAFWIGMADNGIFRFQNDKISKIETGTLLDDTSTLAMTVDSDGTIFFGTERGAVSFHNGIFEESHNEALSTSKINKIIRDREGNIWFGSDKNGIGKLSQGKFNVTKLEIPVNAIVEDAGGRIWVGTDKGVRCYSGEREITNRLTEFTKNYRIRHVGTNSKGEILVSCSAKPALLLYNPRTESIKNWSGDNGLAGNRVQIAIETAPNEYYVGTTTGLSIIHADGRIKSVRQSDGLENEYVTCLHKDNNNVVWVGTDGGGIYLMKDDAIIANITSDDGLIGNVISRITQDGEGAYWICTGSGISYCAPFDSSSSLPESYENINSDNGIDTDSVFQVIFDTMSKVWLTSNYGIASVRLDELLESARTGENMTSIQWYDRNDGLDSDGISSTAMSICDKSGKLWFALVDGFAVYDPVKIYENPVMPLVHIESVTIDNVEYPSGTQEFILKPGTKRVVIKFTGFSFDAPDRIQFMHRLTNFEDQFSLPSKSRIVSYTNISPGRHTFLVSAINGEGLSSEEADAMSFVQKPYFHQMPVFWIFMVILLVNSVGAIIHFKHRAIRLENIRLEEKVQVRTQELAAEKDKSDRLLRAILPDEIADKLKGDVHSVAESFADVSILFSDIVSFTKVSSSHTASEMVEALNDLFSRFDERAKAMGVEKIKTIGDAYMAACGIPVANSEHTRVILEFAKGISSDLDDYNKNAKIQFAMRIGLNSGPVTAGVIGKTKFVYDVWGDTVNVANRMETVCNPGKIRVSQNIYVHLKDSGVRFSEPIECEVKGKGKMITYEVEK